MDITDIKNKYNEMIENISNDKKFEELKAEMNTLLQEAFDKYGEKEVIKEYQNFVGSRWSDSK